MTPWRHREPVPAAWACRDRTTSGAGSPGKRVVSHSPVGAGDLAWFAATFGDLDDPDVMSRAWQ
jgi:hypothetical protein